MKKEDKTKAIEMLVLAVKIMNPKWSDEQAKNIIVNVGQMIELERLEKKMTNVL